MSKIYIFIIVVVLVVGGFIAYQKRGAIGEKVNFNNPIANNNNNSASETGNNPSAAEDPVLGQPANPNQSTAIGLNIAAPANGARVTSSRLTVKGTTAGGAEVTVNEQDLQADSQGNFSATVDLDEGENSIIVTANDASGNWNEVEISVSYEPAQ